MKTGIKILITIFALFQFLFTQNVSYNQEFVVNTYISGAQEYQALCQLSDSGFVICWYSEYQDDGDGGIYGQIYNKNGSRRGTEFRVNTYSDGNQWGRSSFACGLKSGGFVVCWAGPDPEHGGPTIRAQLFENSGERRSIEFKVNTRQTYAQHYPSVSELKEGGFVICWMAVDDVVGYGVFFQVFNDDGSRRGEESHVNQSYRNKTTSVSALGNGGFVVCWRNGPANWNYESKILARIYDSNGMPKTDEFIVSEGEGFVNNNPRVSNFAEDRFVVCWERLSTGDDYYRETFGYGQIFNNIGEEITDEFLINAHPFITDKYSNDRIDVTKIVDNGFLISWPQFSENMGIYCQFFDNNGNRKENNFKVSHPEEWTSDSPRVCEYMDGGFVVCWNGWLQQYYDDGIIAKFYLKEVQHELNPFSLLEPTFDSTVETIKPVFKWQKASVLRINLPWEIKYILYLDEDENFSSPTVIDSIYNTTYTVQNLTPGTTYFWKVLAKNIAGDSLWSNETNAFFVDWNATGIERITNSQPKKYKLYQNYPNPFNPSTTIKFEVAQPSHILLKIFDIQGREVAVLIDEVMHTGLHQVSFNAEELTSGVYFYHILMGNYSETRKMLLMR